MKIVPLSMFLIRSKWNYFDSSEIPKLYSFEFTKGFKFLLFFQLIPNFADICIEKIDENSIFINVFIRSR